MRLSWKLLPVAALFALGVFLVSLPAGVRPTSANAVSITATPISVGASYTVQANLTNNPAGTPASIIATGFGTFTNVSVPVVSPAGGTVATPTGVNTAILTIPGESGGTANDVIAVTATFTCNTTGSVVFTLTQGSTVVNSASTPVNCGTGGTGTGTATISTVSTLLAQGAQGSYTATASTTLAGQTITISASPAFVAFGQPNVVLTGFGITDTVTGQNTANLIITAVQVGTRTITGTFTCLQQGTLVLTISISGLTPAYSQSIVCGTGLLTPTVGVASNVTVAASPTSVSCNGTAFVTVTVRNSAGGYVADGTSVTLAASLGTLSPTTATTLGGGVLAVYTAPGSQSGTATIQASAAGAAQGSTSITVNCTSVTPTPAIPPTIFVPPSTSSGGGTGTGAIQPPNTGDAGLAGSNAWQTFAGIAVIAISAIMAAAVVRTRA